MCWLLNWLNFFFFMRTYTTMNLWLLIIVAINVNNLSVLKQFDLVINSRHLLVLLRSFIMLKNLKDALLLQLKSLKEPQSHVFEKIFSSNQFWIDLDKKGCCATSNLKNDWISNSHLKDVKEMKKSHRGSLLWLIIVSEIIIIIQSFRIGTYKNKNIDHWGKEETCAYEQNHISLLRDSAMQNALNVCFFIYFIITHKKKIILKKKFK